MKIKSEIKSLRVKFNGQNYDKLRAIANWHGTSITGFVSELINKYLDTVPLKEGKKNDD